MKPIALDRLWLALLAATAVTWLLGEAGWVDAAHAWPVLLVFGLALAKGLIIALDFLELRHAPAVWRRFIVGWLVVTLGAILTLHFAA